MKPIIRRASEWLPVLAVSALTNIGYAQPQAPEVRPGRSPYDVTVTGSPPVRPRIPPPSPAFSPRDPDLTKANHVSSKGLPSPQATYEAAPQAMPSLPPAAMPQGVATQQTTPQYPPGYPQGYTPPPMPTNNYFLTPGTGYGYGPPPATGYGWGPPPGMGYGWGPPPGMGYGWGPPPGMGYGWGPPPSPVWYGPPPGTGYGWGPPPGVPYGSGPPPGVPFATNAGLNAVTNQAVAVPTSRASNRVRVRGPGLFGETLARLGERLTQFGRARIETTQETELYTPMSQPSGGVATISSSGSTPLIQQQNSVSYPPGQGQGAPPPQQQPPCQPQPPAPSPQAEPSVSRGHWWK